MSRNNAKGRVRRTQLNIKEDITTICYGHYDKWDSRAEAVKYFYECANASEGSERERYVNIMMKLMSGASIASDGSEYGQR